MPRYTSDFFKEKNKQIQEHVFKAGTLFFREKKGFPLNVH